MGSAPVECSDRQRRSAHKVAAIGQSASGGYRRLLIVLEVFDLAQALGRLFSCFVRATQILSLFRCHFVTAFYFIDHGLPPRHRVPETRVRGSTGNYLNSEVIFGAVVSADAYA